MDSSIFREEMDPRAYQALKKGDIASLKMLLQESTRSLNGTTAKKNTALHVAASLNYSWSMLEILDIFHNHLSIQFAVNSRGDTPLHCAARSGQNVMVNFLIGTAIGPSGQLHLHMMQNEHGDTPLHEAARNCHFGIASALMKADARLGEVMNKHGESAVYLAAERGAVEIVRTLLQFPTCAVAGPKGQTALHALPWLKSHVFKLCLQGTPLGIIKLWKSMISFEHDIDSFTVQHKIMVQLASAGSQFSPQRMDLMTKKLRRKDTEEIKRYRALANNLSIVAVLVGTVTFAAAFTLPGGYENNGPNSGMAILVKKATFKAFLISDAVAMVSSITVTCLLIYTGSLDHDVRLHSISTAMKFMWVALGGMVVAFSMGTYAVVSSGCKWLAILICFMACSVPIIAWLIACWPAIGSLKLYQNAPKIIEPQTLGNSAVTS